MELPLAFGPPFVNVYLLSTSRGWVLVDTGMGTNDCFAVLDRALVALGIEWRSLTDILLTHLHPDHTGLADRLRKLSGAKVWMHPAEAALSERLHHNRGEALELEESMRGEGVPLHRLEAVLTAYRRLVQIFPCVRPDLRLTEGAMVDGWQALVTPGHSPGHVVLYHSDTRVLLSGDQVIEKISPHIGWMPGGDALGDFLDSLKRLTELNVETILPSHGRPFSGLAAWVERTTGHHEERCRQIESFLRPSTGTAADVIQRLWTRELGPMEYYLAFTEVLAHLVFLERRNRVRRVSGGWRS